MPIRVPFEVGFPERKTPFSTHGGARSAPAIAGVGWFWANGGFDSALSWKKEEVRLLWGMSGIFSPVPRFLSNSESARRGGKHPMLDNWEEREEVVAAGSICPLPDCGALVISYRPPDDSVNLTWPTLII
jgi:hypothetical protein